MADDITLSFSSDEDFSSVGKFEVPTEAVSKKRPSGPARPSTAPHVGGVAIRTDAMRLSNQLKRASPVVVADTQVSALFLEEKLG